MIGEEIGNYRLVRLLGQGGFADVYLGENVFVENKKTAIKVLQTHLSDDERVRFMGEARVLVDLEHPQIVHVYDVGVIKKKNAAYPYIVMEYAPNGTLRQAHPRGTVVPLRLVVAYVKQIADALQYAHNRGLVHRDVKPENMLIGVGKNVLLSDFGIAVASHTRAPTQEQTQEVVGTIVYMPPEQLKGMPSSASDQYSLAIVVYEWLCGQPPFQGTTLEVMGQHLNQLPMPLHTRNPDIAPGVSRVVMKALAKKPEQRYSSVSAFAQALEEAHRKAKAGVHDTDPPLTKTSIELIQPEPDRRKLIVAGLGLIAAAAILVGTGFVTVNALQHTPTSRHHAGAGTLLYTYSGHKLPVNAVAWSPDGKHIISGSDDDSIQIWSPTEAQTTPQQPQFADSVTSLSWSTDGNHIVIGIKDGSLQVVNVSTQKSNSYPTIYGPVRSVSFAPDNIHVIAGYQGKECVIWDVATRKIINTIGIAATVDSVSWSPKNKNTQIAFGDASGIVIVQDYRQTSASVTYLRSVTAISDLAWSPDGTLIASADATGIHVWKPTPPTGNDVVTYKQIKPLALAWSPGGAYLASGGADNTVQIWHAQSGKSVYTYKGHSQQINALAWSPDGKLIASASSDTTVQVWYPLPS